MIATSDFLTALECTKFVFGRGSAPNPAGGAHDSPPDPLVGCGGGYPLPIPHPLDAFGVSVSSPTETRPRAFGARRSVVDPPPSSLNFPPMLGVWIKH